MYLHAQCYKECMYSEIGIFLYFVNARTYIITLCIHMIHTRLFMHQMKLWKRAFQISFNLCNLSTTRHKSFSVHFFDCSKISMMDVNSCSDTLNQSSKTTSQQDKHNCNTLTENIVL